MEFERDIKYFKEKGLPTEPGRYLVKGAWGVPTPREIDVYVHPIKGLSCFSEDFGSGGTDGMDDATDCHVSVQFTGLEFISRIGPIR